MKFLPLSEMDDVTSALNFDTPDCRVIGGCDLYTTKAAGSDKKLYKNIESSLESQYESLLKFSASYSPPPNTKTTNTNMPSSINLSRSSPFGPLSEISSRRTFAYLIATLNASHPDYDFSHILRPADFRKERSLKTVINTIDTTMQNLRPSPSFSRGLQVPAQTSYTTTASAAPTSQAWGPNMWTLIDNQMNLKECVVYKYCEDPLDGEDCSIWTLNYFFFNKLKKRVAYLHVRGIPIMAFSPRTGMAKRHAGATNEGATKRAKYWLGNRAAAVTLVDDDDDDNMDLSAWSLSDSIEPEYDNDYEFCDEYDDEADDESEDLSYVSHRRDMSEEVVAGMDID